MIITDQFNGLEDILEFEGDNELELTYFLGSVRANAVAAARQAGIALDGDEALVEFDDFFDSQCVDFIPAQMAGMTFDDDQLDDAAEIESFFFISEEAQVALSEIAGSTFDDATEDAEPDEWFESLSDEILADVIAGSAFDDQAEEADQESEWFESLADDEPAISGQALDDGEDGQDLDGDGFSFVMDEPPPAEMAGEAFDEDEVQDDTELEFSFVIRDEPVVDGIAGYADDQLIGDEIEPGIDFETWSSIVDDAPAFDFIIPPALDDAEDDDSGDTYSLAPTVDDVVTQVDPPTRRGIPWRDRWQQDEERKLIRTNNAALMKVFEEFLRVSA